MAEICENIIARDETMDIDLKETGTTTHLGEHLESAQNTSPGGTEEAHVTLKTWVVISVRDQLLSKIMYK